MRGKTTHPIWKSDTGITGLEATPAELSKSEIPGIKAAWASLQEQLHGSEQLSNFTDRLNREWAIETGIIENLYAIDRGVTRTLINTGFRAELLTHGSTNKPPEYVIRLLRDHKNALEGIFDFVKNKRSLSTSYIKELHATLLHSQEVTEGKNSLGHDVESPLIKGAWKTQENYPVRENVTYTYCPPEQVGSEMDRLIEIHAGHIGAKVPSEIQAAWLHHRFTQIHPFQDGNGRVSRAIASLILVKDGLFPLVVTRDDREKYIAALEAADDGNLKKLIDLIAKLQITQFQKATAISEELLAKDGVQAALDGLGRAANKITQKNLAAFENVFELAEDIKNNLDERLKEIQPEIDKQLNQVSNNANAYATVERSNDSTDHYYRSQIFQNAKNIGYFANTAPHRSWIALKMSWSRRAHLVFAFHGIGRSFNGSLICTPFLEFKDTDEEGQTDNTPVPVAEEGFIFFFNEKPDRLLDRFKQWREEVLMIAVQQLAQNL